MENVKKQIVSPEKFDYAMLHEDVRRWCKYHKTAMQNLSTDVFFRSEGYVSNGLSKKNLPLNVLMKLVDIIGGEMKRYEIIPKPEPVPEPEPAPTVMEEPAQDVTPDGKSGWGMDVMVNIEFRSVAVRLTNDGKEVTIGRSYLYGKDPVGIAQSISYAAHMCYKLLQQRKIAELGYQKIAQDEEIEAEMAKAEAEEPEPTVDELAGRRLLFKDWVKKYESANSAYGKFARYVNSHYPHFPSTSEKKMRYYLRLNGGETHIQTFDVLFAMYRNQDRQQFAEQSMKGVK